MRIFNRFRKKKFFIVLFLIAIFMIPILKIKAFDYIDLTRTMSFNEFDYGSDKEPNTDEHSTTESICNKLSNFFKNTSYNYVIIATSSGGSPDTPEDKYYNGCSLYILPSDTGSSVDLKMEQSSNQILFRLQKSAITFPHISNLYKAQHLIDFINTNGRLPNDSNETGSFINKGNYMINSVFMGIYYDSNTGISTWGNRDMLYDTNLDLIIKKQSSVIYDITFDDGNTFINDNDLYPVYPKGPSENDYIGNQVYSIDNVINDSLSHNIEFSFYLKDDEKYIIDGLINYSLYENNGLYHYKKNIGGCIPYDYKETKNGNKWTIKLIDLTCDYSDGAIEHYYKLNLNNVIDYAYLELKETMTTHYVNTYSWDRIIKKINTNQFKYINFSSDLDNYIDTIYLSSNEVNDKRLDDILFFTYFDLDKLDFFDYVDSVNLGNNNFSYNIFIGKEIKRGFTLNRINTDILNEDYNHFNFNLIFKPDNLYFKMTPLDGTARNDNTTIIATDGNQRDVDIQLEDGVGTGEYTNYSSLFQNINKFMRDNMMYISEYFGLFNYGFYQLDSRIRNFTITIFIMLVTFVIINRIRK